MSVAAGGPGSAPSGRVVEVHHEEVRRPSVGDDVPVVVLSNSLGSNLSMWDQQVDALAEHFRVVRYDTRGHGRSPVPDGPYSIDDLVDDVVALLDRLGVQRAHFVGLSLGGMTGMRLAARERDRVDRLALLCTGAAMPPAANWTTRAATVRAQGTGAVAEAVVARWFTDAFREAQPEQIAHFEQMVAATPAEGYAGCCEVIAEMDLSADLASVRAVTLVLCGQDDPAAPPAMMQLIADAISGSQFLVVPQSAHLANVEQPQAVTAALLSHLAGD
ncbi:3-oxoadipate enol-lactonase [Ornithinimicrobium cryptoxanthini]|uniref:3-oxoadipate enol-lactonase n=1 Tax=Ornithinimicrobium cryptoxanthini TaxID=2934161 RepID=UPI0021197385|nr:3-oxoadipate enol-lactonase [Ornithinimicrobium cryptoxanthini]